MSQNTIASIDPNFNVTESFGREDVVLRNCREEPFTVHGVFWSEGKFRRMPREVAEATSTGVNALHQHTAGGRVRFVTDSPFVAINAVIPQKGMMPHFALTGSSGFDLYVDNEYLKSFVPPYNYAGGYQGIIPIPGERKKHTIMIDFPLYSHVSELFIGLIPDAVLEKAPDYRYSLPAVFYGSSITQGGCASRPGTCYQAPISRYFDLDYINLGFSGNAKGEDPMIEHLASLPTSLFFLDYDHNAPTVEHLAATHERLFLAFRKTHPDTPVIMMTRPKLKLSAEEVQRRAVVETTYKNALAHGDKNVYFIDGTALTVLCGNEGTVDSCHPTDYGFASMAKALIELIEREHIL